jgi:uncharacterized protein (TIGR00369 family)
MSAPTFHHRRLEDIFDKVPINRTHFPGSRLQVGHGKAEVTLPVEPHYFHAINALHAAIYFKLMDDAAYFACNSLEPVVMLLTTRFEMKLLRPVTQGTLVASATCTISQGHRFEASVKLMCNGSLVGTGTGIFARSEIAVQAV